MLAFRSEERTAGLDAARLDAAGVADPAHGTALAVGYAALAVLVASLWVAQHGASTDLHLAWLAVLLLAAAFAERIGLQLGPRSWYSPSAPVILAAALLGGPLAGLAAGASSQFLRTEVVWRRRLAEGGLASLQGFAAGAVAVQLAAAGTAPAVTGAVAASFALMTAGRGFVIWQRRIPGARGTWLRGTAVDVVEAILLVPLLSTLTIAAQTSEAAVVGTIASLLAAVGLAERLRARYGEALARERENARTDDLTGAPNRRAFEELLAAEHARVVRGSRPAALFLLDVDSFKAVNDRFGHAVGDAVLGAVVSRLGGGLRAGDTVARGGGEELTVLAPGLDGACDVERFADRLRRLVAETPFEAGETSVHVTVSVGATLLDGRVPPEQALGRADAALYAAKETRDAVALRLGGAPPRSGPALLRPAVERARRAAC
jgi:diguanylate cyclase (GGDEF)-like protein